MRASTRTTALLAMLMMGLTAPAAAQAIDVGGEIRPRFELRTEVPDGPIRDDRQEITTMRARLSVAAVLTESVRAFVQIQDVRAWGSEGSTTDASADNLDVHQAWAELGDPEVGPWALRLGRQELAYGDERLIGALNWAQQARSFDGLRLRVRPVDALALDGLALRMGEDDAGMADAGLYGVYGTLDFAGTVQGYALYHKADLVVPPLTEPTEGTDQYTVGGRWEGAAGIVTWGVEGAYQTGERFGVTGSLFPADVSAYLLAARLGARLGERTAAAVRYDHLSGDDDPADDEIRVFDTLFATNHKFYGFMDYFLNIPVDTRGRGLQDLALELSLRAREDVRLAADLHSFRLAETLDTESGHVGEELDLTGRWAYAPGVALTGGVSCLWTGDAWTEVLQRPDGDPFWGYLMLDVVF